ncbi:hypothetical protein K8R14_01450 [bacterium]|nr:hypothetical protein [bacterium]
MLGDYQLKAGHFPPFWLYDNFTIRQNQRVANLLNLQTVPPYAGSLLGRIKLKAIPSVISFFKDTWITHMFGLIITSMLLIIPDSWFIGVFGCKIPDLWKLGMFIFFIASIIAITFDLISCNGKKQLNKYNYQVRLIKEWRVFIEQFDFKNNNFGSTTIYASMRPYMNKDVIKKFEAKRTFYVCSDGGRGANLFKQWMSDEVSDIERKWELI